MNPTQLASEHDTQHVAVKRAVRLWHATPKKRRANYEARMKTARNELGTHLVSIHRRTPDTLGKLPAAELAAIHESEVH